MNYFKAKKWQKKSHFQALVEQFYAEEKKIQADNRNFLALTREYADAWPTICLHPEKFPVEQVESYKALMVETVEDAWGPCSFDFDTYQCKIFVTSRDGKAMELVSGMVISDGVMMPTPKQDETKPAEYGSYLQNIENACNDWLTWMENTK